MSRSLVGGLLLIAGLVLVGTFTFVVDLPGGLAFSAIFLLGVVPTVVGAAILRAEWRRSSKERNPQAERLTGIKDQIVWRAMAQGGRITTGEAASFLGVPPLEVEHALLSLIAEGRAVPEPSDSSDIVYRIDSPLAG